MSEQRPGPDIDTSVSHVARIWNYWLGGKDNYPVDREVGDQILGMLPDVARLARASRLFLNRVVWHLAAEAGIRQFIDIGTGLPTVDNTHEVAQRAAPESRIVYVDNDPLILEHAKSLLTSTPEGHTAYIHADLREPEGILEGAADTLDFSQPVAFTLMGILEFVPDDEQAYGIVRRLMGAVPSGSYFSMYDGTNVIHGEASDRIVDVWNSAGNAQLALRTPEQIAGFFEGLEVLEPGIVPVTHWRPETPGEPEAVDAYGGVGRKP
ncbi:SAM-dependent methyltransferase [Actinomadura sp. BRA 177]|uniref:SAM-dependent methyltransferase n=1 Tax=Actinomadura sp. BRA 177 TaxID=2745202 RepID=UPI0015954C2E|nr:SAM-dependent methyltransferase [Actinomadura sp. BRA 177]NVI87422.1 SAM-dependent methyltransferase [Actinomadura sp. BRA 177]